MKFRILAASLLSAGALLLAGTSDYSFARGNGDLLKETDPAFFMTPDARRIANQILVWQRVTGGWLSYNYTVLPDWSFGGRWDPEAHIRSLWNVLAY